jgi:hypothetical protein
MLDSNIDAIALRIIKKCGGKIYGNETVVDLEPIDGFKGSWVSRRSFAQGKGIDWLVNKCDDVLRFSSVPNIDNLVLVIRPPNDALLVNVKDERILSLS